MTNDQVHRCLRSPLCIVADALPSCDWACALVGVVVPVEGQIHLVRLHEPLEDSRSIRDLGQHATVFDCHTPLPAPFGDTVAVSAGLCNKHLMCGSNASFSQQRCRRRGD
jgi:hypothetical protein